MNFWKSELTAELTGADLPGSLRRIGEQGILLSEVVPTGLLSVTFRFSRKDGSRLSALCEKRGDRLVILRRTGPWWLLLNLLHRPVLTVGMGFLLLAMLWLPTRVFFFRAEGNVTVPAARIIEASGIPFGASRRALRSEQIKNELLRQLPDLKWAGVNTRGMVATVSVRERTRSETREPVPGPCHIVAAADGIVDTCTATEGTLLCAPGQAVTRGQILISGYTDTGRSLRAVNPAGTIFARTRRTLSAVTPAETVLRGKETGKKQFYRLLIGKNQIKFGKGSGICPPVCGRMYAEYYITLPGDFRLPLGLGVEEIRYYETEPFRVLPAEAEARLVSSARQNFPMAAGEILSAREDMTAEDGLYRLTGTWLCHEMIGRVRQEQIGE